MISRRRANQGSAYVFQTTSPSEALENLVEFIDSLSPDDFSSPNRQNALVNKVNALIGLVNAGDLGSLCEAIDKLPNDILPKTDGESPPPDWVTNPTAQQELEDSITRIIAQLQSIVNSLGGCP